MENLDKVDRLLRQIPSGIRAVEVAKKLGISRSGAYDYLNTLEARGKARNEHGLWYHTDPVQSGPAQRGWLGDTEFYAEVSRIREDHVNGRIERAYRRTKLLIEAGKVSKGLLEKNRQLLRTLRAEEEAIAKYSIEQYNPDRRRRILRLKAAIVDQALKHWS